MVEYYERIAMKTIIIKSDREGKKKQKQKPAEKGGIRRYL